VDRGVSVGRIGAATTEQPTRNAPTAFEATTRICETLPTLDHQGSVESNVHQRTVYYPEELANGYHLMLDSGVQCRRGPGAVKARRQSRPFHLRFYAGQLGVGTEAWKSPQQPTNN